MNTMKRFLLIAIPTLTVGVIFSLLALVDLTLAQEPPNPDTPAAATSSGTQTPAATTGETSATPTRKGYSVEVSGTMQWVDTKIDLRRGEKLQITADGTITYADPKKNHFGPAGITRSFADLIHQYAVPNGGHGELIGRLGSGDMGEGFEVGASSTYVAPVAGRLFLGINQSMKDAAMATGSFQVKIDVLNEGVGTADAAIVGGPAETSLPAITPALLESIPRRIADMNHSPGDMVNILIVGTEDESVHYCGLGQGRQVRGRHGDGRPAGYV